MCRPNRRNSRVTFLRKVPCPRWRQMYPNLWLAALAKVIEEGIFASLRSLSGAALNAPYSVAFIDARRLTAARSNPSSPAFALLIVGEEGFEPPYDRIKTCCLTAWRLPSHSDNSPICRDFRLYGLFVFTLLPLRASRARAKRGDSRTSRRSDRRRPTPSSSRKVWYQRPGSGSMHWRRRQVALCERGISRRS